MKCTLRKKAGEPCTYNCKAQFKAAFAKHILSTHIDNELRMKVHQLQILTTQARVKVAEKYAWRCPTEGCCMSIRHDVVTKHINKVHFGEAAYRRASDSRTHVYTEILKHILEA